MSGSDSLQLVIFEISKSLREITETLALVGCIYVSKLSYNVICKSFYGFRVYIIPRLFTNNKWLKSLGEWAIVTGCTHGIGLGYAKELAKRGINLILISRNDLLLEKVSKSLEARYKIKIITITADLSDVKSFEKIEKIVLANDIGILINNVGTSTEPKFYHLTEPDSIQRIINLNINCLTSMTRIVLPKMVEKNKGAIVNISSGIVNLPGSLFTVYASSKAFTDKFTETLRCEYRKSKIYFQNVSPGLVDTQLSAKNMGKSRMSFNIDGLKYSSSALSTLGYSYFTMGHWLHGLQSLIISLIPKALINRLWAYQAEKLLLERQKNSTDTLEFDDIDLILNSD